MRARVHLVQIKVGLAERLNLFGWDENHKQLADEVMSGALGARQPSSDSIEKPSVKDSERT